MQERFPPELLYHVRESIEDCGFCVFGAEDMDRLLGGVKGGMRARRQALEEFATLTGARMETTPNMNAARFVGLQNDTHPVLHSPVCPARTMEFSEIEPGLYAYTCPMSKGVWIPLKAYLEWREIHGQDPVKVPPDYVPEAMDDSKRAALICPESGHVMIRYKVGHGFKFHVDMSPETGGVWLDQGEWEALKSKGLHLELNLMFTGAYQRQIRMAEHEEALDRMFRDRLGEEDVRKTAEFKAWLSAHPKRRQILSYLLYNFRDAEE